MFSQMFTLSAQMGCKGGSVGHHLAMGSEGRRVCTLHGLVDALFCHLKGAFFLDNQDILSIADLSMPTELSDFWHQADATCPEKSFC